MCKALALDSDHLCLCISPGSSPLGYLHSCLSLVLPLFLFFYFPLNPELHLQVLLSRKGLTRELSGLILGLGASVCCCLTLPCTLPAHSVTFYPLFQYQSITKLWALTPAYAGVCIVLSVAVITAIVLGLRRAGKEEDRKIEGANYAGA